MTSYQIDLGQGKVPQWLFFGFSTLERLNGNERLCTTRFQPGDLVEFDITRFHESLTGFPLQGSGLAAGSFYLNFLKQTQRYRNPWSSGVLSFSEFLRSNFIIVVNLEWLQIEEGALTVKLKFKQPQNEKLCFLWMPCERRKLVIDSNLGVSVE